MVEATRTGGGMTRRQAISRMAAGTAVAWTAPELIHSAMAYGATVSSAACPVCAVGCVNTSDFHPCGVDPRNKLTVNGVVLDLTVCGCRPLAGGGCFCHEDVYCPFTTACTSDADCATVGLTGYRCIVTDCCGLPANGGRERVCAPPCGTLPTYITV